MNEEGSAKKRTWFYVTWGAILVIGDGLCWGTADYFWTHNLTSCGDFFFWMLWVVSILSASRVILETWERPKIVWTVAGACSLGVGIIIILVPPLTPAEPFIEGTQITQSRVSTTFPFGYAIFWFGQNRILENKVFKNGLMDWKVDVDNVKIAPDFFAGLVKWTIPNISAVSDTSSGSAQTTLNVGKLNLTVPLRKEVAYIGGAIFGNNPVLYVVTLSDNQRNPVFALGYRIPTKNEGERPPQQH